MENVKSNIESLSDEELLNQFTNFADQYTEEAKGYFREEIKKRNLSIGKTEAAAPVQLNEEDFSKLDHSFNKIDLDLVAAMFRDENILFFIDNSSSSNTIPIKSEADLQFTMHIHKTSLEKAHFLLDEHFEKEEGKYLLKNRSVKDQLRAISFNVLSVSEEEAAESVEVDFTENEKRFLIDQAKEIIKNADKIEAEKGRVLFFFDNFEPLISKMENGGEKVFTKSELLTVLEIIQITVELETFDSFMEDATKTLLGMFLK